jgi:hypothetical protein
MKKPMAKAKARSQLPPIAHATTTTIAARLT